MRNSGVTRKKKTISAPRVYCRVTSSGHSSSSHTRVLAFGENAVHLQDECRQHTFPMDGLFMQPSTQHEVFMNVAAPLVHDLFDGSSDHSSHNAALITYGPPSSGKSYSMWGPLRSRGRCRTPPVEANSGSSFVETAGIAQRSCEYIFTLLDRQREPERQKYMVAAAFFEINNDTIIDLIAKTVGIEHRCNSKTELGSYCNKLTHMKVATPKDLLKLVQDCLDETKAGSGHLLLQLTLIRQGSHVEAHTGGNGPLDLSHLIRGRRNSVCGGHYGHGQSTENSQLNHLLFIDLVAPDRHATDKKFLATNNKALLSLSQMLKAAASPQVSMFTPTSSTLTRVINAIIDITDNGNTSNNNSSIFNSSSINTSLNNVSTTSSKYINHQPEGGTKVTLAVLLHIHENPDSEGTMHTLRFSKELQPAGVPRPAVPGPPNDTYHFLVTPSPYAPTQQHAQSPSKVHKSYTGMPCSPREYHNTRGYSHSPRRSSSTAPTSRRMSYSGGGAIGAPPLSPPRVTSQQQPQQGDGAVRSRSANSRIPLSAADSSTSVASTTNGTINAKGGSYAAGYNSPEKRSRSNTNISPSSVGPPKKTQQQQRKKNVTGDGSVAASQSSSSSAAHPQTAPLPTRVDNNIAQQFMQFLQAQHQNGLLTEDDLAVKSPEPPQNVGANRPTSGNNRRRSMPQQTPPKREKEREVKEQREKELQNRNVSGIQWQDLVGYATKLNKIANAQSSGNMETMLHESVLNSPTNNAQFSVVQDVEPPQAREILPIPETPPPPPMANQYTATIVNSSNNTSRECLQTSQLHEWSEEIHTTTVTNTSCTSLAHAADTNTSGQMDPLNTSEDDIAEAESIVQSGIRHEEFDRLKSRILELEKERERDEKKNLQLQDAIKENTELTESKLMEIKGLEGKFGEQEHQINELTTQLERVLNEKYELEQHISKQEHSYEEKWKIQTEKALKLQKDEFSKMNEQMQQQVQSLQDKFATLEAERHDEVDKWKIRSDELANKLNWAEEERVLLKHKVQDLEAKNSVMSQELQQSKLPHSPSDSISLTSSAAPTTQNNPTMLGGLGAQSIAHSIGAKSNLSELGNAPHSSSTSSTSSKISATLLTSRSQHLLNIDDNAQPPKLDLAHNPPFRQDDKDTTTTNGASHHTNKNDGHRRGLLGGTNTNNTNDDSCIEDTTDRGGYLSPSTELSSSEDDLLSEVTATGSGSASAGARRRGGQGNNGNNGRASYNVNTSKIPLPTVHGNKESNNNTRINDCRMSIGEELSDTDSSMFGCETTASEGTSVLDRMIMSAEKDIGIDYKLGNSKKDKHLLSNKSSTGLSHHLAQYDIDINKDDSSAKQTTSALIAKLEQSTVMSSILIQNKSTSSLEENNNSRTFTKSPTKNNGTNNKFSFLPSTNLSIMPATQPEKEKERERVEHANETTTTKQPQTSCSSPSHASMSLFNFNKDKPSNIGTTNTDNKRNNTSEDDVLQQLSNWTKESVPKLGASNNADSENNDSWSKLLLTFGMDKEGNEKKQSSTTTKLNKSNDSLPSLNDILSGIPFEQPSEARMQRNITGGVLNTQTTKAKSTTSSNRLTHSSLLDITHNRPTSPTISSEFDDVLMTTDDEANPPTGLLSSKKLGAISPTFSLPGGNTDVGLMLQGAFGQSTQTIKTPSKDDALAQLKL